MTKQDILNYVRTTPENTNCAVLGSMIDELLASENPIPDIPEGTIFAEAGYISEGASALVLVNNEWVLITGTNPAPK